MISSDTPITGLSGGQSRALMIASSFVTRASCVRYLIYIPPKRPPSPVPSDLRIPVL